MRRHVRMRSSPATLQRPSAEGARRGTGCGRRPTSCARRCSTSSAPRIAGARVLDGYAGTGAVGIEALSRGAAHVTFVDAIGARRRSSRRTCALRRHRALCYYPRWICRRGRRPPASRVVRHRSCSIRRTRSRRAGSGARRGGRLRRRRTRVLVLEHARRDAPPAEAGQLAADAESDVGRQRAGVLPEQLAARRHVHASAFTFERCPPSPSIPARSIR